jgi:uncharacterized membrane protein
MQHLNLGHKVAPPRFIAFAIVFVVGLVAAIPPLGWSRGAMAAFSAASLVFLILVATLLRKGEAAQIRRTARNNDANRVVLLVLTGLTLLIVLVAVGKEMQGKSDPWVIALVIATLVLAWLFSNTVYALHYAHLYYLESDEGKDSGGLEFPSCDEPDYWDFVYFSFTLGMTFQTSDVEIHSRQLRRVTIGQCLAAFVFNLGVLAFTINTLGSGGN